jgi:hypothetical protein
MTSMSEMISLEQDENGEKVGVDGIMNNEFGQSGSH